MFDGVNAVTLAAVLIVLHLFGWAYNALVAWMERDGRDRGYTALLVVGGNLVTVGVMGIVVGVEAAALVMVGFAASGLPMTLGSWWRHTQERMRQEHESAEHILRALERVE